MGRMKEKGWQMIWISVSPKPTHKRFDLDTCPPSEVLMKLETVEGWGASQLYARLILIKSWPWFSYSSTKYLRCWEWPRSPRKIWTLVPSLKLLCAIVSQKDAERFVVGRITAWLVFWGITLACNYHIQTALFFVSSTFRACKSKWVSGIMYWILVLNLNVCFMDQI